MKSTLMNRYGANTVPAFSPNVLTLKLGVEAVFHSQNGKKR
jgi:hypothetical protein